MVNTDVHACQVCDFQWVGLPNELCSECRTVQRNTSHHAGHPGHCWALAVTEARLGVEIMESAARLGYLTEARIALHNGLRRPLPLTKLLGSDPSALQLRALDYRECLERASSALDADDLLSARAHLLPATAPARFERTRQRPRKVRA